MTNFFPRKISLAAISYLTLSTSVFAEDYININYGAAGSTSSINLSINNEHILDYLGLEAGWSHFNTFEVGEETMLHDFIYSRAKVVHKDFLFSDLSINAGLGVGVLFNNAADYYKSKNNFSFHVTPSVGLNYRINKYFDLNANYQMIMDSAYDLNSFGLGLSIYYDRQEPVVTILNDNNIDDSLLALINTGTEQSEQINEMKSQYGLTATDTYIYLLNTTEVEFEEVEVEVPHYLAMAVPDIAIPDEEDNDDLEDNYSNIVKISLSGGYGQQTVQLPRGQYEVIFRLRGKYKETEKQFEITARNSLVLYQKQGMEFVLTVKDTMFGESLYVEAL